MSTPRSSRQPPVYAPRHSVATDGIMAPGLAAESPATAETSAVAPVTKEDAPPTTLKQPPPEKPSDIRRRSFVVLSFWVIVVLLGLPIWWKTTSIYRANLPIDGMLQWAEGKVGFSWCKFGWCC